MILNEEKQIKRLVIYFFYDADGVVDRYVSYMLKDVMENCSEIFVVCNGKLNEKGYKAFQQFTSNILVRENIGFDVWAYKEAMEHYGWARLEEYDEIILMNYTIMGPVYPFSEMFAEMDKRDLDFWGITVYHKQDTNPFRVSYGYIPEHLQSHFIAVRQSMVKSREFQNYWDNRPPILSYEDAVGKHEAVFTKFFADKGFTWDKYIDTDDLKNFTPYPLMWCSQRMIEEKKCPIFKRRAFFHTYLDAVENSDTCQAKDLLCFFKNSALYDVSLIWENIIRTCNMSDIKNNLHLIWTIPKGQDYSLKRQNIKVALVLHIYFDDLIECCYKYSLSMARDADLYITTDCEDKCIKIEAVFKRGPWKNVKTILVKNRGRDVSALLVGAAPYIADYDYVCFAHDKKVTQLAVGVQGHCFSKHCFENILGSKEYVNNIIERFETEPFLGLLCPPPPNLGHYYSTLGCEWGENYEITEKLHRLLEIKAPIDQNKEPVAPFGTMFWFRPKALKKLFDKGWNYEDFPKEPNDVDGTILHGIERLYPFVVQDAGYYTAYCITDEYAQTELTNLSFIVRGLNTALFDIYGSQNYNGLLLELEKHPDRGRGKIHLWQKKVKKFLKSFIPSAVWQRLRNMYHSIGGKKWVG